MSDTFTKEQVDQAVNEAKQGLLTQERVDQVVQERLARERSKYQDYDVLVKFKEEHDKTKSQEEQKLLEEQRRYEEAKKTLEGKQTELQKVITDKDARISDMEITHVLTGEISKQNGYVDDTLAIVKGLVGRREDKSIYIKGKDTNGIDIQDTVEAGLQKFFKERPYLVKASGTGGSGGTGGTGSSGGAGGGAEDLMVLNGQLQQALAVSDQKAVTEIRAKIQNIFTQKKINRSV